MIFDDDDLHEEVEQMFKEEANKAIRAAKPTRKFPPGYYDDKLDEGHYARIDFNKELLELRRKQHKGKKK